MPTPYIPQTVTVHLGAPDEPAANVTVNFPDYIKNVASSEIYPTWDESAITANINAQVSFVLNRVYTEYYRSRGYDFTITSSTAYDQKFIQGRNIFENIDRITDEIFNRYIRRQGTEEPLFAQFCNGTTTTCDGLSQWGSQALAEEGLNSIEILRNYYGNDIELVVNVPISGIRSSYPGSPVRIGDTGNDVIVIQRELNRISQNYPAIPKINPVDGIFGENTQNSVIKFQEIFNLTSDGIVGEATWYKLVFLYVGVTRLSELESEGQRFFGFSKEYPENNAAAVFANSDGGNFDNVNSGVIEEDEESERVELVQYFLAVIAEFNDVIPPINVTGVFDEQTKNAVMEFQRNFGLAVTGEVDALTWDAMYRQYYGDFVTIFSNNEIFPISTRPYGGRVLYIGSSGEAVRILQIYLNTISNAQNGTMPIGVTGNFGRQTAQTVIQYQRGFGLPATGRVDEQTWNSIANTYKDVASALTTRAVQYPGYVLKEGMRDSLIEPEGMK